MYSRDDRGGMRYRTSKPEGGLSKKERVLRTGAAENAGDLDELDWSLGGIHVD